MTAIIIAAILTGNDPYLLGAIAHVESNTNPGAIHYNDGKGHSYGAFQIKLRTAWGMGFRGFARDLQNIESNAYYAGKYISSIKLSTHTQRLQVYNCGHPCGNRQYVRKVLNEYNKRRATYLLLRYSFYTQSIYPIRVQLLPEMSERSDNGSGGVIAPTIRYLSPQVRKDYHRMLQRGGWTPVEGFGY